MRRFFSILGLLFLPVSLLGQGYGGPTGYGGSPKATQELADRLKEQVTNHKFGVTFPVTPNIGLNVPVAGTLNWDVPLNANSVILDNIFALATCGDATHALGWNKTSKVLFCQTLSGGGGGVTSVFTQTGAIPNLSGDVTTSNSSVTTLAGVNSNVGSFTNANITVNAKGLITAAANGTIGVQTVFGTVGPNITALTITSGDSLTFSGSGTNNASSLLSGTWAVPGTIGSTTPNTGAFTTLSASGTVSGTGFSTYLASPPAIGGTAPAAGTFTAIIGTNVTDSALTPGDCVQAGTGGLLTTTAGACGSGGGGVASIFGSSGTVTSLTVPTGGSIATSGSGTNAATSVPVAGIVGQLLLNQIGTVGLSGTSPLSIAATGVATCLTCVVATVSPSAGIATFAGSTQTVTSTATTGSGSVVLATSATLVTPLLGTPTSVVLTNATGLPLSTGVTGQLPIAAVGSAGLSGTLPITINSAGAIGCVTCSVLSGLTSGTIPIATSTTGIGNGPLTVASGVVINADPFNGPSVITASQPAIDCMAILFGCKGDGTTDDSAAIQAAEAYMQAHGGYVMFEAGHTFKINTMVTVNSNDTFVGAAPTDNANTKGAVLTCATATGCFGSATPSSFISGVTINYLTMNGGTNPIDIPFLNQGTFEQLEIINETGCGIAIVAGERYRFNIVGVNNNNNGFAPICMGDTTKSIFGGLTPSSGYGLSYIDELIIHDIGNLGGSPNVGSHWSLWAADNGIDNMPSAFISCEFSGITGTVQLGSGTTALQNSFINGIVRDHCGQSGTPEAISIYVNGNMTNSTISGINEAASGYETISAKIGCMQGSSIEHSQFLNTVDNTSTFGLYMACTGTNIGSIKDVQGGVFSANGTGPSVYSSNLSPSNLSWSGQTALGFQAMDPTGTGEDFVTFNGLGTLVTAPFVFARGIASSGFANDFQSFGAASGGLAMNEEVNTLASTTTRAGLNLPHGSAPTSPVNGDVWTTTAGMYVRINSGTVGPFAASLSIPTGTATFAAGSGVTSVVCATGFSCNNTRGTLTIVGGTATTGTIATVSFSATLSAAPACFASENGGSTNFGIGNSAPSTTAFNITSAISVLSATFNVNYTCQP